MNVQGLAPQTVQSKVPFISDTIVHEKQLFIGLSETWLKNHQDAELEIEGYTIFRCDTVRKKAKRGRETGGTAFYVRDDIAITCEPIIMYSSEAIQLLCLYSKVENIAIACLYRQPDDRAHGHPSTASNFKTALDKLVAGLAGLSPAPDIILGGDFNLPHVSWPAGTPSQGASVEEKHMLNYLNEMCNELLLTQVIKTSTHKDGNILDLVFVNNGGIVHDINVIPVLQSTSHHSIVQISTTYKADPPANTSTRPKPSMFNALNYFHKDVDWSNLEATLGNVEWEETFRGKTPDEMLDSIYSICYKASAECVPERVSSDSKKSSRVQRFRKSLANRRRRIAKRLIKLTSPARRDKLKAEMIDIEKKLQKSYRDSEIDMEEKAVEAIKTNPKYFYTYTKKRSKCTSKIGPLLKDKDQLTDDNKEMAELLSKQYSSVFSKPKAASDDEEPVPPGNKLSDIQFTSKDMEDVIEELSSNAAAGMDGFPAILLKKCKTQLSLPLTIFWRKCLDDGYIPPRLKKSIITPIHKGDSRAVSANYRPIALTSHIIKMFEKILRRHVVKFMNENNLFNDNQHGFRSGRSCLSQLLEHFDQILDLLENGGNVDVIYLDFSKAFDKLDFKIVLRKIKAMGIDGRVFDWIKSFLTERTQQVSVNGILSDPAAVISGVPQGSVLGPLLFLILIADIDAEVIHAIIKSFADDTRAMKGINTKEDVATLQRELEKIYKWSDDNNMGLNDKKFEGMRLGPDEKIKSETSYTSPSGKIIEMKDTVKDLGVLMSDDCTFKANIDKVIEKAKNISSWVLRTFKTRQEKPMLLLFKMLILPVLEYCSVLWSPQDVGSIQKLESVQWSFVRKIWSNVESDYWLRLKSFNMYSLQRRRERYRIIYIWKVIEGHVPNVNNKINSIQHARLGRKCQLPKIPSGKLGKIREASLVFNGAQLFNVLPKPLRDMSGVSLDSFKRALDQFLNTVPDEPQIPGYTACRRADSNSLIHMCKSKAAPASLVVLAEAEHTDGPVQPGNV